jgi:hypothetical protein
MAAAVLPMPGGPDSSSTPPCLRPVGSCLCGWQRRPSTAIERAEAAGRTCGRRSCEADCDAGTAGASIRESAEGVDDSSS